MRGAGADEGWAVAMGRGGAMGEEAMWDGPTARAHFLKMAPQDEMCTPPLAAPLMLHTLWTTRVALLMRSACAWLLMLAAHHVRVALLVRTVPPVGPTPRPPVSARCTASLPFGPRLPSLHPLLPWLRRSTLPSRNSR